MIIHANTLPENTVIQTDLCIIGAGAAGITIAKEFINTQTQVCLLESGGTEFNLKTQNLYSGSSEGTPYSHNHRPDPKIDNSRLRFFGGSTNHWAGMCRPLDESDFLKHDHIPYSGWPIKRKDLNPYYNKAQKVIGLSPTLGQNRSTDSLTSPIDIGDHSPFIHKPYQYSKPINFFGKTYKEEIHRAKNIQSILNSNVINIQPTSNGTSIAQLDVQDSQGKSFQVKAKHFVLATGGIENARLLLASQSITKKGLGNGHDLVGRFFMEHLHSAPAAMIVPTTRQIAHNFSKYKANFALSPRADFLTAKKMVNVGATFRNLPLRHFLSFQTNSYKQIQKDIAETYNTLLNMISDPNSKEKPHSINASDAQSNKVMTLSILSEQRPDPENRVILSGEKDSLGMKRSHLQWAIKESDKESIKTFLFALAQEFGRLNLGRLYFHSDFFNFTTGGAHHMGTTRMHANPKEGVVDEQCRVHGIDNLHIAGSSVFPTGGFANPTFTIVALAIRLANHLKEALK